MQSLSKYTEQPVTGQLYCVRLDVDE